MVRSLILILLINCFSSTAHSQVTDHHEEFKTIEKAIRQRKNLSDTKQAADGLLRQSLQQNDPLTAARCYYYRMLINDRRTEDSMFFKNSAFMDSLLAENAEPVLKGIVYLLQAKRLKKFVNNYSWTHYDRKKFIRQDIPVNYALMTDDSINLISRNYFQFAKQLLGGIQINTIGDALWLSSDPYLFLFKPSFYDIVLLEQINDETEQSPGNWFRSWSKLLQLSPNDFIATMDTVTGYNKINLYAEWIHHYKTIDGEKAFFIESLARKSFYQSGVNYNDSSNEKQYEAYLLNLSNSRYSTVKAHAVFQLFNIWVKWGTEYCGTDNNANSYSRNSGNFYDSSKRFYLTKAIQLITIHNNLLDSFAYLKNIMLLVRKQLEKPLLRLKIEQFALPGSPILTRLSWNNLPYAYMRIVKINHDDHPVNDPLSLAKEYFLSRPVIVEKKIPVINEIKDYQVHSSYLKLDALPAGHYCVILSDSTPTEANDLLKFYEITVTNLTMINDDNKIFVLDRGTGVPRVHAKALVTYSVYDTARRNYVPGSAASFAINENGSFDMPHKRIHRLLLIENSDTLVANYNANNRYEDNEKIYNKEDYDDKFEYYKENAEVRLFTDRGIYRPGQTVYFKGILLTRDPKTAELVVFNKENLHFPLLQKLFSKEVKDLARKKFLFFLEDPFNRNIDSLRISVNEYGSVSGSFVIPKTAATGEWTIQIDDDDDVDFDFTRGHAEFNVEEYKRPSFEVKIERPEQMLLPADSFHFTVKLRSFAGAQLNKVLVKYELRRKGNIPYYDSVEEKYKTKYQDITLEEDESYTDESGQLKIVVNDSAARIYNFHPPGQINYSYSIEVTAVDPSGESQTISDEQKITDKPIRISVKGEAISDISEIQPLTIKTELNREPVNKLTRLKLYLLPVEQKRAYRFDPVDASIYEKGVLENIFPEIIRVVASPTDTSKELLLDTFIQCNGTRKMLLPVERLRPGNYLIDASCIESGRLLGKASFNFMLYDSGKKSSPQPVFHHLVSNAVQPGEAIIWKTANMETAIYAIYQINFYEKTKKGLKRRTIYETKYQEAGIHQFNFIMPGDVTDKVKIVQVYVSDNQIYKAEENIFVDNPKISYPEIQIERYRTTLTPGSSETFSVSVKTNNQNTAAELMTAMYDASLDKLQKHNWDYFTNDRPVYLDNAWPYSINSFNYEPTYSSNAFSMDEKERPLWWLNPLDYAYDEIRVTSSVQMDEMFVMGSSPGAGSQLAGRVAGLQVNLSSLSEVVVTAMGIKRQTRELGYSTTRITLRGNRSISNGIGALIIIDGVVYTGDLKNFDINSATDIVVLKDAEATALYGSQAANGVIIISTKGHIQLPSPPEPTVVVRRNFNETAFFFPHIYADRNGYYKFTFSMPESTTEWRWMMIAHTKAAKFAYKEVKIFTQLPLMVKPNMPRVIYQGDKVFLQTRISNLDSNNISGKISCSAEDAVTGEDISRQLLTATEQNFQTNAKSNSNSGFEINIPETLLNPVKIKITARAGNFADAEEHLLPVLSRRIFITQSVPFSLERNTDTTIVSPDFPGDATGYGIGLYITPKPQSALINSLSYLANYPYDCAEQTFNKMLAHAAAVNLMRTDTSLQNSFKQLDNSTSTIETKKLPDELPQATMPWLDLDSKTNNAQEQLRLVLDTFKSKEKIDQYLIDLRGLQNADGGMAWFKNGRSDEYISNYILQSSGNADANGLSDLQQNMKSLSSSIVEKLVSYCDTEFRKKSISSFVSIDYLLGRSYWAPSYPLGTLKSKVDAAMTAAWKNIYSSSLSSQAKLVIATLQLYAPADSMYKKAIQQLHSLEQLAIKDAANGIRWKDLSDADDLSSSGEETMALLLQAFNKGGMHNEMAPGILQWLLGPKNEHQYSNTKAIAGIVNGLMQERSIGGATQDISAHFAGKQITVTNDLLKGKLFSFEKTGNTLPGKINIGKFNGAPASGNISYYYFTANPGKNTGVADINVTKKVFVMAANNEWKEISEQTKLSPGDKLKTVLSIETSRRLRYVFINDPRAACQEPTDALSGYEYEGRFSYYRSISDIGFRFFAESIPSGSSEISYETVVSQKGIFFTGTTELQLMYRPDIKAYASGSVMKVE